MPIQQLPNSNPIIVLEAGATHNGNLVAIRRIIGAAAESGADAIKFQTVWADNLTEHRRGSLNYRDATGEHRQPILNMLRSRELDWAGWESVDKMCHEYWIPWFSTPDIPSTAKILGNCQGPMVRYDFRCCGIKIAGADMHRTDLIRAAAFTGLRVLLDTKGGEEELNDALAICRDHRSDTIIVHSPTGYPTNDPNLSRVTELKDQYPNHIIGFTSHSPGTLDCEQAIKAGAGYIEKGITLDRKQPGIEHLICLEPGELKEFIDLIRETYDGCN